MAIQIEDVVQNCAVCARYQRSNTKEPLQSHSPPYRPWEKVGADLCEFVRRTYLVLVDYYSNFIEVDHLKETTSSAVITHSLHATEFRTFSLQIMDHNSRVSYSMIFQESTNLNITPAVHSFHSPMGRWRRQSRP